MFITITIFSAEPENKDLLSGMPPEIKQTLLENASSLKEAINSYKKLMSSNKKNFETLSSYRFFKILVKGLSDRFNLNEYELLTALAFNNSAGNQYFRKKFAKFDLNKKNDLVKKALLWSHLYQDQATLLQPLFTYLYRDKYFNQFNKTRKELADGTLITMNFAHTPLIKIENRYYRIDNEGLLSKEEYIGVTPIKDDEIPTRNFKDVKSWPSDKPCKADAFAGNLYHERELSLLVFWLLYPCPKKPTIVYGIFDLKTKALIQYQFTFSI